MLIGRTRALIELDVIYPDRLGDRHPRCRCTLSVVVRTGKKQTSQLTFVDNRQARVPMLHSRADAARVRRREDIPDLEKAQRALAPVQIER
jgi:hypothetical protein